MNSFILIISILFAAFILFQIYMFLKSKKSVGNDIPFDRIDNKIAEKIKNKNGLLYFYSPTCHNCKKLTPLINKLKKEFEDIVSVDVSTNLETARAFNVMGTPSLLFVGANKIKGFYVGIKNEDFIKEKLNAS